MGNRLWLLVVVVMLVGVTLVAVLPINTFLDQRATLRRANDQLEVLTGTNEALAERARLLLSDAEIERLAREQHNLVLPGEEAYAILPAPTPTTTTSTMSP